MASSGVVTFDSGFYAIHNDLTISANDTFLIDSTVIVLMAPGVLITSLGHLNFNQTKGILPIEFLPFGPGLNYLGLRIENDDNSILKKVIFIEAGGIRLLNADIQIEQCVFTNFDQSYSTGVINLFQSSPQISQCHFMNNQGSAFNSGANVFSAPKIINCIIENNNSNNSNAPQINLGPSGPNDTIVIKGNSILGNRNFTIVGGISTSNLLGIASQNVLIDSNLIVDNRYGITCTGSNINSIITRNTIIDNNSQNDPNLGGSGINFNGGNTNVSRVGGNKIHGNLWGITIQGNANPNMGDSSIANTGYNCFRNNENLGITYALYNNTSGPIKAQLNDWGDSIPENVIVHNVDISNLGLVDFSMAQMGLENFGLSIDYKIINDTIYFSNQAQGTIIQSKWQFPQNAFYYNQLNPEHPIGQFIAGNPYEVDINLRGECSSKDTTVEIDLSCGFSVNYPAINVEIDTGNLSIDFSENVSLDSVGGSLEYNWDFGDGNISQDSLGFHSYDTSGFYILTLTIINQCGDTLSFSDTVHIPFTVALESKIQNDVKIYPNPFDDEIRVKSTAKGKYDLIDIHGSLLISGELKVELNKIPLSYVKSGIYFLRISYLNKEPTFHRLIKK